MSVSFLESLLYGALTGFTEILPVSSQAHGAVLRRMFGVEQLFVLDAAVHFAVLMCLFVHLRSRLRTIRRERFLADIPRALRDREPDSGAVLELRLLHTAAVPMMLLMLLQPRLQAMQGKLLLSALFLLVNGCILYLPRLLPSGNKDSRSLTPLDGVLLGICRGLSVLPGISGMGVGLSAAQIRGADRRYALEMILLLSIVALALLLAGDVIHIVVDGLFAFSWPLVFSALLAAAAAYIGASVAIAVLRFLAVKTGFSVFAYYSWGAALFVFIFYLMI